MCLSRRCLRRLHRPSRALRIRYVSLDAVSVSLLSQPFNQFGRRIGTPKIDNAEETPLFPDVDAYLAIQNTPAFPPNYSMYYVDLDLANDAPADQLISSMML